MVHTRPSSSLSPRAHAGGPGPGDPNPPSRGSKRREGGLELAPDLDRRDGARQVPARVRSKRIHDQGRLGDRQLDDPLGARDGRRPRGHIQKPLAALRAQQLGRLGRKRGKSHARQDFGPTLRILGPGRDEGGADGAPAGSFVPSVEGFDAVLRALGANSAEGDLVFAGALVQGRQAGKHRPQFLARRAAGGGDRRERRVELVGDARDQSPDDGSLLRGQQPLLRFLKLGVGFRESLVDRDEVSLIATRLSFERASSSVRTLTWASRPTW